MGDQRPAKWVVRRQLWLEVLRRRAPQRQENTLLYVTLPGAQGLDIDLLIDEGLLDVTETGAIADGSQRVVVGIESNSDARVQLLQKRPGLEIISESFENLLRGRSRIRYPQGVHVDVLRPLVLNLDLNSPLILELDGGRRLDCPLVESLVKVATLQRDTPHAEGWTLLLTLHGSIVVAERDLPEICDGLAAVMDENFTTSATYSEHFSSIVGASPDADWFRTICTLRGEDDDPASEATRQRALLMIVPKLIADLSSGMGWSVAVDQSALYGGAGEAPMVTWSIDFRPTATAGTHARIASALESVGPGARAIDAAGDLAALL